MKKKLLLTCFAVLFGLLGIHAQDYGIEVNGVKVTDANKNNVLGDGTVTFSSTGNYLWLNATKIKATSGSNHGVSFNPTSAKSLTIYITGSVSLEMNSGAGIFVGRYATVTLTSSSGVLKTTSVNNSGILSYGKLMIQGIDVNAKGSDVGIGGSMSYLTPSLSIAASKVVAEGGSQGAFTNITSMTVGPDCSITSPSGASFDSSKKGVVSGGNIAEKVQISPDSYGVTVAGVSVNAINASDILYSDAANRGKVTYTPSTNTLTLDGAKISTTSNGISSTMYGELIVDVKAESSITSNGNGIYRSNGSLTIKGGNALTITANTANYKPINLYNSADLTVEGAELIVNNSQGSCIGGTSATQTSAVTLKNAVLRGLAKTENNDFSCAIFTNIKTLNLDGSKINVAGTLNIPTPKDFTVNIKGVNTSTSSRWFSYGGGGKINFAGTDYATDNLTIKVSESNYGAIMTNSDVDFKNCTVNVNDALYAFNSISGNGYCNVLFDHSAFNVTNSVYAIKGIAGVSYANGSELITNATWDSSKGGYVSGGSLVKDLKIGDKDYDFRYAGKNIRSMNMANLLPTGATFDSSTNTLTLKNVNTEISSGNSTFVFYKGRNGITIKVEGTNNIGNNNANAMTFYDNDMKATITGTGTLNLTSTSGSALAIPNSGELTIEKITLNAKGGSGAGSYGISGYSGSPSSSLIIDGAKITAEVSGSNPAIAHLKNLTLKGGVSIAAPNGGKFDSSKGYVTDASGFAAKKVEISSVTTYGLIVGATAVTDKNASDIFGDGTASYNNATNTLTLNNAKITDGPIISAEPATFNIVLKGNNKLDNTTSALNFYGIYSTQPVIITGSSKDDVLEISSKAVENKSYWYAPIMAFGDISARNCTIITNDDIRGMACAMEPGIITLDNVSLQSNINTSAKDHAAIANAKQVILKSSTIETTSVGIYSNTELAINCSGKNDIKSASPIAAIVQDKKDQTLTLSGDNIKTSSLNISGALLGILTNSAMTASNMILNASGALYGWASDAGYSLDITLDNVAGLFHGDAQAFYYARPLELKNNTMVTASDVYFNDEKGSYFDENDEYVKDVRFIVAKDYKVAVAGINVTDANQDDVLLDGTVKYDDATNTLSLTNTTISCNNKDIIASYTGKPMTIVLSGINTIASSAKDGNGISVDADLLITSTDGNGELNIIHGNENPYNADKAIFVPGKLTIDGCKVSTKTMLSAVGGNDYVNGEVELKNAVLSAWVTAADGKSAAITNVSSVKMDNSEIIVNGDKYSNGIYANCDIDLIIEGTNSITTKMSEGQNAISLGEHANKLNITGKGIDFSKLIVNAYLSAIETYESGTEINVKDMTLDMQECQYGIDGNSSSLTIDNANFDITASQRAVDNVVSLTMLNDVKILDPADAALDVVMKTIVSNGSTIVQNIKFGPMTATIYDLKVHNTQVTSDNCNDILGDGTLVFEPATRTLTMNNVNHESFAHDFIVSDIDGLTVILKGSNSEHNGVITFNKPTTITGDGELKVTQDIGRGGAAIVANADLHIDHTTLNLQGSTKGISGDGTGKVYVYESYITIPKTLGGSIRDVADLLLVDCGIESPYGGNYETSEKKLCDMYGIPTTDKLVIRPYVEYALRVYEDPVTDINCVDIMYDGGSVKYDDATKTLTVNGYKDDLLGYRFIESNIPGLKINFVGDNKVAGSNITLNEETTITGNAVLESGNTAIVMNGAHTLTIQDADIHIKAPRGILSDGNSILEIRNSNLGIEGITVGINDFAGVALFDCDYAEPLHGKYDTSLLSVVDQNGYAVNNIVIKPAKNYDIFINMKGLGEYQVSALIADDILNDGGTMKYDATANKLIMQGVNDINVSVRTIVNNMTIEANGENNIGQMIIEAPTAIEGEGTIIAYDDYNEASVFMSSDLTIKNATLVAVNGLCGYDSQTPTLTVDNGHLTAFGGNNGCISKIGNLVLKETVIVEPTDAAFDATLNAVALNGSMVTSEVRIIPESEAGIHDISLDNDADAKMFDTMGRRVTDSYRGIIIRNGKKYTNK